MSAPTTGHHTQRSLSSVARPSVVGRLAHGGASPPLPSTSILHQPAFHPMDWSFCCPASPAVAACRPALPVRARARRPAGLHNPIPRPVRIRANCPITSGWSSPFLVHMRGHSQELHHGLVRGDHALRLLRGEIVRSARRRSASAPTRCSTARPPSAARGTGRRRQGDQHLSACPATGRLLPRAVLRMNCPTPRQPRPGPRRPDENERADSESTSPFLYKSSVQLTAPQGIADHRRLQSRWRLPRQPPRQR